LAPAAPAAEPVTAPPSTIRASAARLIATLRERLAALSRQRTVGSDPLARAAGFAKALDALAAPAPAGR
jgi:hypothetical protein